MERNCTLYVSRGAAPSSRPCASTARRRCRCSRCSPDAALRWERRRDSPAPCRPLAGLGAWLAEQHGGGAGPGSRKCSGSSLTPPAPWMARSIAAIAVAALPRYRRAVAHGQRPWRSAPDRRIAVDGAVGARRCLGLRRGRRAPSSGWWRSASLGGIQRQRPTLPRRSKVAGCRRRGRHRRGVARCHRLAVTTCGDDRDAPHYLAITRSLATTATSICRTTTTRAPMADFYQGSLEPRHTNTSPWGEDYSFHGPGVSVLVAPAHGSAPPEPPPSSCCSCRRRRRCCGLRPGNSWRRWRGVVRLGGPRAVGALRTPRRRHLSRRTSRHRGRRRSLARRDPASGPGGAALDTRGRQRRPCRPALAPRAPGVTRRLFGLAILWAIRRGQPDRWTRVDGS